MTEWLGTGTPGTTITSAATHTPFFWQRNFLPEDISAQFTFKALAEAFNVQ